MDGHSDDWMTIVGVVGDVHQLGLGQPVEVVSGIGIGVIGALMLARLMTGLLYGITTRDPITFAAVVAVLVVVTLFASLVPARRATKVDPMEAIRSFASLRMTTSYAQDDNAA